MMYKCLCVCICTCSEGTCVSVSVIFAVYSFPEGGSFGKQESRKRKMVICEKHEDEEASCGGRKSAETQAMCSQGGEKEKTAREAVGYIQRCRGI